MCGVAGAIRLSAGKIADLDRRLVVMNKLLRHRGPDGEGTWTHPAGHVGFGHRRLAIIDLETGDQPMKDHGSNWVTYNGEIYNYIELRAELGPDRFATTTDTETILEAYREWGTDCVNHLRGMFAFGLWDEDTQTLFCARDRFGIKPFYYTVVDDVLYFASEVKALLPFVEKVETDLEGFKDYLAFQFCLAGKTLFKGIRELLQVEDRMSMAHGLESRVPFLDHALVEMAATMPSDVKFKDGTLKNLLRKSMAHVLPDSIVQRKDKMGFPVPLTEWLRGEVREFVCDILTTRKAKTRDLTHNDAVLERLDSETKFGRTLWGMLCLEMWQQEFHDKHHEYTGLIENPDNTRQDRIVLN